MIRFPGRCSSCGKVHLPQAFVPVLAVTLVAGLLLAVAMSDRIAAAISGRGGRLTTASAGRDVPILINGASGPLSVLGAVAAPAGAQTAAPGGGTSTGHTGGSSSDTGTTTAAGASAGGSPPPSTTAAVSTTVRGAAATTTTRPTAQSSTVPVPTTVSVTTTTPPGAPATSSVTTTTTTRPAQLGGLLDLCVLSGLGLPWCN
jgi:hypothetical protein